MGLRRDDGWFGGNRSTVMSAEFHNSEVFLRPRLIGDRFAAHSIPLEFLADFAALEEMVVEVAKWRFLQSRPARQRSPRGFADGITLRLTGVEEGSAIPVISIFFSDGTLFGSDVRQFFDEARESIIGAIDAAERQASVLNHLPDKVLGYFDRLGRSLRDGEAIEFSAPEHGSPVRLTKETRRRLVLASVRVNAVTEETSVCGRVPEVDQDDQTFELQLEDGRKVKAPLAAPHADAIFDAFNGYKSGVRSQVDGIGKFSRSDKLIEIESIERIVLLDPLDIPSRLDEFARLEDGWLEGIGRAPDKHGLAWLAAEFERQYPDDLPRPYLYPMEDGGVQAEWVLGDAEASLDIDILRQTGIWHSLERGTGKHEERTLQLTSADDWKWLAGRIRGGREPGHD
jgi:hypothetical protein